MKYFLTLSLIITLCCNIFAEKYRCDANELHIRTKPNITNSRVLSSVHKGDTIDIVHIQDGWAELEYSGEKAYLNSKFLTRINITPKSGSFIVSLAERLYAYGFHDWEFYLIVIAGLILSIAGYFVWGIDDLLFGIEDLDNNLPGLYMIWGVLFGAFTSISEENVYNYLNDFSLIPVGAGFAVWVLWIAAVFICITTMAFVIKSIIKMRASAILRVVLTMFLALASLIVCAMIIHMFIDWLQGVLGTILLLVVLYLLVFTNGERSPDFTIKDKYGNVFSGWIHDK